MMMKQQMMKKFRNKIFSFSWPKHKLIMRIESVLMLMLIVSFCKHFYLFQCLY